EVVFATVARLFERKGHDDLLAAAPEALQSNPKVRFLWIGSGLLRGRLEREAGRAGGRSGIHLTGLVPPDRIPALLAASDAVVHTSLREDLPRVLPQALLVARPVITYDLDGAREVARPETGILLAPRNTRALASAIVKLSADAELRARLGQEGRRR